MASDTAWDKAKAAGRRDLARRSVVPRRLSPRMAGSTILRFVLILVMMLSLGGQSVITQSHIHFASSGTAGSYAAHGRSNPQAASLSSSRGQPATCPICREIAHAGYYIPPAPIIFHQPDTFAVWLATALLPLWTGRRRSHAWHSRGPPTGLLQE